jgi:hypothetical protein
MARVRYTYGKFLNVFFDEFFDLQYNLSHCELQNLSTFDLVSETALFFYLFNAVFS